MSALDPPAVVPAPGPMSPARPLYWSVKRELWENRSIYAASAAVAAVVLFASSTRALGLPHRMRTLSELDPAKQHAVVVMPYSIAESMIILTAYIVAASYPCSPCPRSGRTWPSWRPMGRPSTSSWAF